MTIARYSSEVLLEFDAAVGEGPVWSAPRRELSWVDITAGNWHRTSVDTGATRTVNLPTMIGAISPALDGGWVAAGTEGFVALNDDGQVRRRLHVLPEPRVRMNDAKCDSVGRLWSGSNAIDFSTGRGRIHRLDGDWSSHVLVHGMTLPNGLGFSPDDRRFYLIDSLTHILFEFDFDRDDGAITNQRVLVEWESGLIPDGACVDADGGIWVALWGSGVVQRYSASGVLIGELACPVGQPSSCAFLDGTSLVITSARQGMGDAQLEAEPLAGSLFVADVGVEGVPVAPFSGPTA